MKIKIEFNPACFFVGIYYDITPKIEIGDMILDLSKIGAFYKVIHKEVFKVRLCIMPFFPMCIEWESVRYDEAADESTKNVYEESL